jgi:hypothetical protein
MGTTIEIKTDVTFNSLMNKRKEHLAHFALMLLDLDTAAIDRAEQARAWAALWKRAAKLNRAGWNETYAALVKALEDGATRAPEAALRNAGAGPESCGEVALEQMREAQDGNE